MALRIPSIFRRREDDRSEFEVRYKEIRNNRESSRGGWLKGSRTHRLRAQWFRFCTSNENSILNNAFLDSPVLFCSMFCALLLLSEIVTLPIDSTVELIIKSLSLVPVVLLLLVLFVGGVIVGCDEAFGIMWGVSVSWNIDCMKLLFKYNSSYTVNKYPPSLCFSSTPL